MFENLDTVEWHKLQHAYGSAENVPQLIRALLSEDEETRKKALSDLYNNIIHQGSIYEAASYTVPFFVEILEFPEAKDKAELLYYLQHLAHGGSYANSHKGFSFVYSAEKLASEEFKNQLNSELSWVELTHNAILKHQELYIQLMESSLEPAVRCRAVGLLASFAELRASLLPRLIERLKQETEFDVQTGIINILWKFVDANDQENLDFIRTYLASDDELIRLIVAQTLARIYRENTPSEIIAILAKYLDYDENLDERYVKLTWSANRVFPSTIEVICLLDYQQARSFVPKILDTIEKLGFKWLNWVSRLLMFLLFGKEKLPEGTTAKDLDDLQIRALRLMDTYAKSLDKSRLAVFHQIGRSLRLYGLPFRPADLDAFLNE